MNRKRLVVSAVFILLAMVLVACEKQTETPPGAEGTVKASPTYVEHFGQPPTPEEGNCYARVGFFPLRGDPVKVRAVPFFLFRETGQLQQLLERVANKELSLPPDSELFNPFPETTKILVDRGNDNQVDLNVSFSEHRPSERELKAIATVLTETAVQFDGIDRVVILLDGEPLDGAPADGFRHDPGHIAHVGPPVLFMVGGTWEKGESDPVEVTANFDRPVTVETFHLEDASGKEIRGDYFRSVFDMSVVIHPDDPGDLQEGMTLRGRWEVTDGHGRDGKGSAEFSLQRFEHP